MSAAPSIVRSSQPAISALRRRDHAPVIVGFDPGLHHTGYGVLRRAGPRPTVCECGVLATGAGADLGARLRRLHRDVEALLGDVRPDLVVLEDLFTHSRFPRTAIVLGHVRGVIWLAAASAGHRVLALAPSVVKRAVTGSGRASKAQVQAALCGLLGLRTLGNAHAADALALAYAGLARGAGPRLEARR
jgi:crossover junction endodeoxyribonuclease RuvC